MLSASSLISSLLKNMLDFFRLAASLHKVDSLFWCKPAYIQHYPGRQRCSERSQIDHHFLAARQNRSTLGSMTLTDFFQGYGSSEDSLDRDLVKTENKKKGIFIYLAG